MKNLWLIFLILLGSFLVTGNAIAHRVNVFAWAEGDTVFVEAKFSGGKKIIGGKIIVTDSSGVEVLTGLTNDRGEFSFKRHQPTELKIILEAGMGHRAEWSLPVDDGHADHAADEPQSKNTQAGIHTGASRAEIEAIVEKALDKKMKPVLKMLAESQKRGSSIGDILGGIGYIIGLVGIAAYFHSRKKKNSK
jgi:nickel transport protein